MKGRTWCIVLLVVAVTSACALADAGALTTLPAVPEEPAWDEDIREDVQRALDAYEERPVHAYFDLVELQVFKESELAPEHSAWLAETLTTARPHVLTVCLQDFDQAVAAGDFRGALVSLAVALRVDPDGVGTERQQAVAELRAQVTSGEPLASPVFVIDAANGDLGATRATYASPIFGGGMMILDEDGVSQSDARLSVEPEPGWQLLHVEATGRLTSDQPDLDYVTSAFATIKRHFYDVSEALSALSGGPGARVVDAEFLNVITPDGQWLPCRLAPPSSVGLLAPATLCALNLAVRDAQGGLEQRPVGTFVHKDESFDLDAWFMVPEGVTDLRLVLVGSDPVPVALED